jgi:hypothetical protein
VFERGEQLLRAELGQLGLGKQRLPGDGHGHARPDAAQLAKQSVPSGLPLSAAAGSVDRPQRESNVATRHYRPGPAVVGDALSLPLTFDQETNLRQEITGLTGGLGFGSAHQEQRQVPGAVSMDGRPRECESSRNVSD